jgi:glucose 1-dehydrogenase
MELHLYGTSAVVTGGGGGMGRQFSKRLLANGVNVVILELNGEAVERSAAELTAEVGNGAQAIPFVGSVASEDDVAAAYDLATERFGVPQMSVNNAGWANMSLVVDTPVSDWDQVFDVCAKGVFLGTREAARRLQAADLPGAIVNISSINWEAATDGICHYAAAKAAVSQFTKVAAAELAPSDINVNAIAPGLTRTPMSEGGFLDGRMGEEFIAHTPLGRFGEPDDIAQGVLFLLSQESGWITGVTLSVDGGSHIRGLHNYWAVMNEGAPA